MMKKSIMKMSCLAMMMAMLAPNFAACGGSATGASGESAAAKKATESGNVIVERLSVSCFTNSRGEEFESKNDITSVTFLDSLADKPNKSAGTYTGDVSAAGDGSVMAWIIEGENEASEKDTSEYTEDADSGEVTYALYIAGDGGVDAGTSCRSMFSCFTSVKTIEFNNCFYTGNVTDMGYMFNDCESLTELDLSCFDTSKVKDMSNMFQGCHVLESVDVSGFDTSKVTDMSHIFDACLQLSEVDVSGWNTAKVKNMAGMFRYCTSLTTVDVSNWDTSKVESMEVMFAACSSLTHLDVSNWDTHNVCNSVNMFSNCDNLDIDRDDLF